MKHQFGHRSEGGKYDNNNTFSDKAEVYGSPVIKDSQILGGKIFGGEIYESTIKDEAIVSGSPHIIKTSVMNSAIIADQGSAYGSVIMGNARLLDKGSVNGVLMRDNAMVCGTGMVIGQPEMVLEEWDYVDRGIWYRRPVTYISKSGFVITENVGHLVTVSCTTNTVSKWLGGAGRRYGQLVGLEEGEIHDMLDAIDSISRLKQQSDYDMMGRP